MKAVAYVRVSSAEQAEHGHSIDEQKRLGLEAVAERGWELLDVFSDPGYSGATDDRPDLQRMLSRLDEIDVIVVWAMDRLTRDVELFAKLAKLFTAANVRIESLTSQIDLTTPEGEAMAGVAAVFGQFERKRIAERVRVALKARKLKGQHNGGPAPDGWMDVDKEREDRPTRRVHDPDRAPVIRPMFELADRGLPDAVLARDLNASGHRTRSGLPWTRRLVQAHLTNPWHAGLVRLDDELVQAKDPDGNDVDPLVDPSTWHRIQSRRAKRDLAAPGQHVQGRPAHRHLLAKLARCGACGSPMFAITSSYRRTDGTRARQYQCRGYQMSDGTCDMKVDAEAVDTAVLENLPKLMPRFDEWIRQIEDRHAAERDRLQQARDQAIADLDAQRRKLERIEDNYLSLDADEQEQLRGALERVRAEHERSEIRVQATTDALASVPEDVAADRLLDFATTLRSVIAGRLDGDHSVGELNRALAELFASFTICTELHEGTLREEVEGALKPDGLYVFPNLRWEVAWRLIAEYEDDEIPAPPMEWIEALSKSANTQELWHCNSEDRSPVAVAVRSADGRALTGEAVVAWAGRPGRPGQPGRPLSGSRSTRTA